MSKGILTEEHAASYKGGELFQPSNGYEGDLFRAEYCDICRKDDPENEVYCEIFGKTLCLDALTDKDYPREWIHGDDGQPTCTAFEADGSYRCPKTEDMFPIS